MPIFHFAFFFLICLTPYFTSAAKILKSETIETNGKRQRWQRIWRYLPLFVWMGFIFFASTGEFSAANTSRIIGPLLRWLFPGISEERLLLAHFITRKAAHFTEYAILGWLAGRAFATSSRDTVSRRWFVLSLIVVVLYALSDEYHQSFVSSRTASIYDSFIDIAGGLAALVIYALWRKRRAPKNASQ